MRAWRKGRKAGLDATCSFCQTIVRKTYLKTHQEKDPGCAAVRLMDELIKEGWCWTSALFLEQDFKKRDIPVRYERTNYVRGTYGTKSKTLKRLYVPPWFQALYFLDDYRDWASTEKETEHFWAEVMEVAKSYKLQQLLIWEAALARKIFLTADGSDPYSIWLKRCDDELAKGTNNDDSTTTTRPSSRSNEEALRAAL